MVDRGRGRRRCKAKREGKVKGKGKPWRRELKRKENGEGRSGDDTWLSCLCGLKDEGAAVAKGERRETLCGKKCNENKNQERCSLVPFASADLESGRVKNNESMTCGISKVTWMCGNVHSVVAHGVCICLRFYVSNFIPFMLMV